MFLYDKTNILEGSGIFEVDFAPSHGPAIVLCHLYSVRQPAQKGMAGRVMEPPEKYLEHIKNILLNTLF